MLSIQANSYTAAAADLQVRARNLNKPESHQAFQDLVVGSLNSESFLATCPSEVRKLTSSAVALSQETSHPGLQQQLLQATLGSLSGGITGSAGAALAQIVSRVVGDDGDSVTPRPFTESRGADLAKRALEKIGQESSPAGERAQMLNSMLSNSAIPGSIRDSMALEGVKALAMFDGFMIAR